MVYNKLPAHVTRGVVVFLWEDIQLIVKCQEGNTYILTYENVLLKARLCNIW